MHHVGVVPFQHGTQLNRASVRVVRHPCGSFVRNLLLLFFKCFDFSSQLRLFFWFDFVIIAKTCCIRPSESPSGCVWRTLKEKNSVLFFFCCCGDIDDLRFVHLTSVAINIHGNGCKNGRKGESLIHGLELQTIQLVWFMRRRGGAVPEKHFLHTIWN